MCYDGSKMSGAFERLYDSLAARKGEANATGPYIGGNGRIDRAVDLIKSDRDFHFPAGSLLDVGGATGNLGYALRGEFSKRYTLDIADDCRVPAESKGNSFIRCNVDVDGLPFLDATSGSGLDLITALDFIEHILDPERFARECFRVLRPGGMVLINTPNIQYWRHLASLVIDGIFPHTSGDTEVYHGGHVGFYNYRDMWKIFQGGAGFVDGKVHYYAVDPAPPIWSSISSISALEMSVADLVYSCRKPMP